MGKKNKESKKKGKKHTTEVLLLAIAIIDLVSNIIDLLDKIFN